MDERLGVNSGNGMVMGAAHGLVLGPLFGFDAGLGLIFGALIGLLAGAASTQVDSKPSIFDPPPEGSPSTANADPPADVRR